MNDDFAINEEILEEAGKMDLKTEMLSEAVDRYHRQLQNMLAHALVAGYDGVDLVHRTDVHAPAWGRFSPEVEGWVGEPEDIRPQYRYTETRQRFDFRTLTDIEKREFVSYIGASLDDIADSPDE
jgi:hypothetical protein